MSLIDKILDPMRQLNLELSRNQEPRSEITAAFGKRLEAKLNESQVIETHRHDLSKLSSLYSLMSDWCSHRGYQLPLVHTPPGV